MASPSKNTSADALQKSPLIMAISNELSSEIAAAILVNKTSEEDRLKLRDVVLEIHSTLQKMSEQAHASRLRTVSIAGTSPSDGRSR